MRQIAVPPSLITPNTAIKHYEIIAKHTRKKAALNEQYGPW
jgi:hypothetical protein